MISKCGADDSVVVGQVSEAVIATITTSSGFSVKTLHDTKEEALNFVNGYKQAKNPTAKTNLIRMRFQVLEMEHIHE